MREYQHKYIVRTLLYSPVTIVILFLMIILLMRSIMELNNKRASVALLRNEAQSKKQETQDELAKAKNQLQDIQTERGFENYVRTTYPIVKQGEGVIVVYDQEGSPVTQVREDMTIWERLLVFIRPFMTRMRTEEK
jgi:hypothetical protein